MKDYPLYERVPFETLRDLMDRSAEQYKDRIAFAWEERKKAHSVSFSRFQAEVQSLSVWLIENYPAGSHIGVLGANSYEWILTYLAVTYAGMVIVPFDKDMPIEEVMDQVRRSDSIMMVLSDEYADYEAPISAGDCTVVLMSRLAASCAKEPDGIIWPVISKDTLAAIVYTSGTTGKSKGVMLSHGNLSSDSYSSCMHVSITNSTLLILPLHHTFGLVASLLCELYMGLTIYINRSLKNIAADLQKYKPAHLFAVPVIVEALYKNIWAAIRKSNKERLVKIMIFVSNALRAIGIDVRKKLFRSVLEGLGGNIEFICSGGAPIDNQYLRGFADFGIVILNGYGITECSPVVAVNRNKFWVEGSVGKPLPVNEVRIAEDGEILVRGANVMLGYYKDEAETKKCMRGGWFCTGDVGKIDSLGALHITGRKKNLIILPNGENISAEELEEKLCRLPSVAEAVVYSESNSIAAEIYPDPETPNAKEQVHIEVKELNSKLAQNKNIAKITLRDTPFPKTSTKKIKREYNRHE